MALPRLGRRRAVAVFVVLAISAFVWAFDWNWIKPQVERHLAADSKREVRIDDLHVGLDEHWRPMTRLRGVRIQNADWAANPSTPMVVAGEATFHYSWGSLWRRDPLVLTQLTLVDADVQLERRADGVRNWRLRNPDDTSPGRVLIESFDAQRSRVRLVHHGVGVDVAFEFSAPTGPTEMVEGYPLLRQIDFGGRWNGQPFTGRAFTGDRITFQQTGQWIPVRGEAQAGDSRLTLEGRVADLFKLSQVDAELTARGPSLAALDPFLRVELPATAPYTLTAHLKKEQREFTFVKLEAEVGRSDLTGELSYDQARTPPHLEAKLQSQQANLADLTGLVRTRPAAPKPAPGAEPETLLPRTPLGAAGLRRIDAEVELRVRELALSPRLPPVQGLRLQATVEQGKLDVKPLQFGWAGGRVSATLGVDATDAAPSARADVQWQRLRLEALMPEQPEARRVTGPLNGRVSLQAQGASLAAMAANGRGTLSMHLAGGTLPGKADARLSLDLGRMLGSLVSGNQPVPIRCGELVAELSDGVLRSKQLVFETTQTRLGGVGTLDLRDERFELWLDPQPRDGGLLTLPSSIRVQGRLRAAGQPEVSLTRARSVPAAEGCDGSKPRAG